MKAIKRNAILDKIDGLAKDYLLYSHHLPIEERLQNEPHVELEDVAEYLQEREWILPKGDLCQDISNRANELYLQIKAEIEAKK